MKKMLLLLASVAITTPAFAADAPAKPAAKAEAKTEDYGDHGIKLFEKLDANKDKFVTVEELKAQHQKFYDKLDVNDDNAVTDPESDKAGKTDEVFDKVDTSNDNKVTFEESFAVEQARFLEYDDNKDGKVSWDEYKTNYDAAAAKAKDTKK